MASLAAVESKGLHYLVVDDIEIVIKTMTRLLKQIDPNAEVDGVQDAEDAYNALIGNPFLAYNPQDPKTPTPKEGKSFDFVFMDNNFFPDPRKEKTEEDQGVAAATRVRAYLAQHPELKLHPHIIAYTNDQDSEKFEKAPFEARLPKPCSKEQLAGCISKMQTIKI